MEIKRLTHYTPSRILIHQRYIAVGNIVKKGEIARNKQFLLFSQCFQPYIALIFHFKYTLKCLQFVSIWTSLKYCHLVMGQSHHKPVNKPIISPDTSVWVAVEELFKDF